jgi:uncharacterized membrane protein
VGTWIVLGAVLLAAWIGIASARRRAAQRAADARARARARRTRVPLVSANVRGQSMDRPDIWRDELDAVSRDERAA